MKQIKQDLITKAFWITFVGMLFLHIAEDSIWILSSRYTDIPVWILYSGVAILAFLATVWGRKDKNKKND